MKHKEITHRTVEKLMFWAFLVFFPLLSIFCLLTGLPAYVWETMLAIPAVIAVFTFVPPLRGAPQAYAAVVCMMTAATLYAWETNTLSTAHGVFLGIMCFAGLYRRVGLTVCQIVYVTMLYASLYLLYPTRFFAHLETPLSAVVRQVLFYLGCAAIILMLVWFRNAVQIMESRAQSITELYKMVEQEKINAEAGSREKADFLANMSHEMRTPMIAVCGMSELLLQNHLTPLEEEYVTTIQNSANNLLSMVNDILDFSKIEANMMNLEETPYRIENLISDVANIINVRIGEKDVAFVTEIAPNIPQELIGDEARIRQILINLLNNAVKFTEKGMIKLRLSYHLDEMNTPWLTAEVSDTGIGITRENQKKLFSEFTQVDTDRSRRNEGTGLGLVISQRLANKMNGSISVESEYGKGSKFTVVMEQKVKSRRELAFVPDPDGYVAYIYEPNECYRENLKTLIESLGVAAIVIHDIAVWDYYNADRFGAMLFFDYAAGIAGVNTFALKIKRMRLITVIDRNTFVDAGIKDNILMMHKPVLTGQLAALIRGDNLDDFRRSRKHENHLFIPDAQILVVDDNYVNLRVTAGLLNVYKPHVEMVSGGREAYEIIKQHPVFDMVFMDHMMPDWDGIETVQHIRAIEGDYYKNVPIVALSANVGQSAKELFLSHGMNDFVEKPMSSETLASVLKKYIPAQKQLSEYTEKVDPMMTVNRSREEYIAAAIRNDSQNVKIEGLDVPRGIFNMGGSLEAYYHILNVFLDDGKEKSMALEKYAEEENIKAYRIEAHSLKSVAASIGADTLSQSAKQHEDAAKTGDWDFIRAHYIELVKQYNTLLFNIEGYLVGHQVRESYEENSEADSSMLPISHQKKHNEAVEIIRLAERFDSDAAIDHINELLKYRLENNDRHALKVALHQLNDYMFDEAIQTLRTL